MQDGELVGIITESDIFKSFLELFGGGQKGIRVTALAPYVKGNLAEISTAVADVGGLILSLNVFEGTDASNWTCTFKASEVSEEELLEAIKPLVVEVLDVREIEAAASCSE
jgi:acetoin utilization protein AcuB